MNWSIKPKCKNQIINLLEENMREIFVIQDQQRFLKQKTHKNTNKKRKINKLIKKNLLSKDTNKKASHKLQGNICETQL